MFFAVRNRRANSGAVFETESEDQTMSKNNDNTPTTTEEKTQNGNNRQAGANEGKAPPDVVDFLDEFNDVQCLHCFFYDAIETLFKELANDLPQGATTHYGFMLFKRYMLGRDQILKEHLFDLHGGKEE